MENSLQSPHSPLVKLIGVLSLSFVALASLIAIYAIFTESTLYGTIYLGILILAPFVILRFYCTKCPCQKNCAHIFPGKIAEHFFAKREGSYTATDILFFGFAMLLLIGYPQIWLIADQGFLLIYWILVVLGGIQVLFVLCRRCGNHYCMLNKIVSSFKKESEKSHPSKKNH
ncbi:MAG: hypothetical protein ACFFB3_12175 [Candidatus Hodarchaeota archaeon]